jgi:hypothetical protein
MNHAMATLLCVVLSAGPAASQTSLGNDLLHACTMPDNLAAEGYCLGYVVGAIEGLKWGAASVIAFAAPEQQSATDLDRMSSGVLGFCVPAEATNIQLRDVVVKHLRENPATRHETARTLVQAALADSFPCS